MHLETDTGQKSDRVEWGHARYQTVFRPDQAYELVVEWLTSSGSIIAELVSSFSCFFMKSLNVKRIAYCKILHLIKNTIYFII